MAKGNPMVKRKELFVRMVGSIALFVLSSAALAIAQEVTETKLIVSDKPFTAEQLSVYKAMLASWFEGEKISGNLAIQTESLDIKADYWSLTCFKRFLFESNTPGLVHRFRAEDLDGLGSDALRLVDPEYQSKVIDEHDPGKEISDGRPLNDAVEDAFSHGLLTLSEIRFDKSHTHALVQFSFRCGRLCGHATPMLMEKKDGTWKRKAICGGYVS
jgi:hypothetical protein